MCEDSANLDKIYQYKISKICHICSNNCMFYLKKGAVKHEGVHISKLLINYATVST